jgi:hypothetical protein
VGGARGSSPVYWQKKLKRIRAKEGSKQCESARTFRLDWRARRWAVLAGWGQQRKW